MREARGRGRGEYAYLKIRSLAFPERHPEVLRETVMTAYGDGHIMVILWSLRRALEDAIFDETADAGYFRSELPTVPPVFWASRFDNSGFHCQNIVVLLHDRKWLLSCMTAYGSSHAWV